MELFKNTNYDFLGKKWPFIIASLVLTVAGLGSIAAKGGLGPLTHIMAREFAPFDIRVNVIATGQTNQVSAEVLDGGTYQDSAASMAATAASPAGAGRFPGNWYMEQLARATPPC